MVTKSSGFQNTLFRCPPHFFSHVRFSFKLELIRPADRHCLGSGSRSIPGGPIPGGLILGSLILGSLILGSLILGSLILGSLILGSLIPDCV